MMKSKPIKAMNQTTPPLRNSQAACLKFQKLPHAVEYHANKITPISSIKPTNNSAHLFIR